MADALDSVKSLVSLYYTWAGRAEAEDRKRDAQIQRERGDNLTELIEELEQLRRITQPIPATYGDLSDLPPSLIKELSGIRADDLEQQLFTIIKSGDEVELDAILIELWRRFKVEQTRKFLQNKLWRMAQKGMIWTIAGKKGVYTATQPAKPIKRVAQQPAAFDTDLDDDVPF
jgi:hypothetical protein